MLDIVIHEDICDQESIDGWMAVALVDPEDYYIHLEGTQYWVPIYQKRAKRLRKREAEWRYNWMIENAPQLLIKLCLRGEILEHLKNRVEEYEEYEDQIEEAQFKKIQAWYRNLSPEESTTRYWEMVQKRCQAVAMAEEIAIAEILYS